MLIDQELRLNMTLYRTRSSPDQMNTIDPQLPLDTYLYYTRDYELSRNGSGLLSEYGFILIDRDSR